jgi:small subunit ribosomal protein S16
MLKIRLSRVGRKHVAKYRVVLTEHKESAKHGFIQVLGSYDPHTKALIMDYDTANKYISTGAQYSETLAKIVKNQSK